MCLQSLTCMSFILCISKPQIFIVTSFNCISIDFYKNQIFEINFVFIERRLRVSLTLSSFVFNTEVVIVK